MTAMGAGAQPDLVAAEIERSLIAALGFLAEQNSLIVDPEAIKVAVRRALRAASDDPWESATLAASDIGLRLRTAIRVIKEIPDDLDRAPLLCFGRHGWLLLTEPRNGGVVAIEAGGEIEYELDDFCTIVEAPSTRSGVECGVAHVSAAAGPTPASDRHGPKTKTTPVERLFSLFVPEKRDIRVLMIFALVVGILNLATPVAVEAIVNTIAFVNLLQPILVLSFVLVVCLGLAAVIFGLEAVIAEMIQRRLFVRVVSDLAWRLPRVRRDAIDHAHGPELVNRFFDVVTVQKLGAKLLLEGISAILSASIGLLVLAFYHPYLLAFDLILIVALLVIIFGVGRRSIRTAVEESSAKYRVADWLEEITRHPIPFRNTGGREIAGDHADTLATHYLDSRKKHFRIVFRQLACALFLQAIMSALLLGLGGWLVTIGELTLGQLVASWLIASLVLTAVAKLGAQLESFYDISASSAKLGMLLDLPLERTNGESLRPTAEGAMVSVHDVSYRYKKGPRLFGHLEFQVMPNEKVALIGANGSGKSTLFELLHGQRDPSSGQIKVNDVDLKSLRLESLRRAVAIAAAGHVIQGTIADNVRMRSQLLTLDELRKALTDVGLWDCIQALPDGVETEVTSDGRPLSASQTALLVLARVIASEPRLLLVDGILDELDDFTLDRVTSTLCSDDAPWTLIVATRRRDIADRFGRTIELGPICVAGDPGKEES